MNTLSLWQQTLQAYRAAGVRLASFEEDTQLQDLTEEPPPPFETLWSLWKQGILDPWQVLVHSAATENPAILEELTERTSLEPLRSLLNRIEHGAIGYWPPTQEHPLSHWRYLLQIGPPRAGGTSSHFILHAPASSEEMDAAEAVLRLALPPSYRRFLLLTNGMGRGRVPAKELALIHGAGPALADWDTVVLNTWLACDGSHEIAAAWRAFQGVYDYERIRDWENGENSFLSDETILVPFGYTYDTWCFDRSSSGTNGEYPVICWDHETRYARDAYPDFSRWFAGEIEAYFFSEYSL